MSSKSLLTHYKLHVRPDPSRTVIRPFEPSYPAAFDDPAHPRMERIVERVLALAPDTVRRQHHAMVAALSPRHRDVEMFLERRFQEVSQHIPLAAKASEEARCLIGAYFSEEYSFEAAALFNPSMVLHDHQTDPTGRSVRFAMSLRGIGEGHVSSVTFRTGNWDPDAGFSIDPPTATAVTPRIAETGVGGENEAVVIICEGSTDVSESVLFPVTPSQRQGIEDLRLVRFIEDDGSVSHLGTYTAFDGRDARSEMLRATDYQRFEMRPLKGSAAQAKGMALFPRKIDGRFAMLGRQDSENIWLLDSDDLYTWEGGAKLVTPRYPWEIVQMGNCGSPIEIDEGWLVLTHGVGMVRNYCMGACLLDKRDPSKLLARTPHPIIKPSAKERDGYVPNVVYSCGAMVHNGMLLLPYGIADNFAAFATVKVSDLLAVME